MSNLRQLYSKYLNAKRKCKTVDYLIENFYLVLEDACAEKFRDSKKNEEFPLPVNIVSSNDISVGIYRVSTRSDSPPQGITCLSIPTSMIDFDTLEEFVFGEMSIIDLISKIVSSRRGKNIWLLKKTLNDVLDSWKHYTTRMGFDTNVFLPPDLDQALMSLSKFRRIWIHNASCRGKTFFALSLMTRFDNRFIYNPHVSEAGCEDWIFALTLLGKDACILFDDMQSLPSFAEEVGLTISQLCDEDKLQSYCIFVSWPEFMNNTNKNLGIVFPSIKNRVDAIFHAIENSFDSSLRPFLGEIPERNIAISDLVRRAGVGQIKSSRALRKFIFSHLVSGMEDDDFVKSIYIIASLGSFELPTPLRLLRALEGVSPEEILASVMRAKSDDQSVFLGHRSICEFLVSYIEENHRIELKKEEIIILYFQYISPERIWRSAVQLLSDDRNHVSGKISDIWNLMHNFVDQLQESTRRDPSWMAVPSSMYFVLKSAELLGISEDYEDVFREFLKCFQTDGHTANVKVEILKTKTDFELIKGRMIEEDEHLDRVKWEKGKDLQAQKAHENWVMGLAAGLKPTFKFFDELELHDTIIQSILARQESSGGWYPLRVPWVTARVLIGLGEAGYGPDMFAVANGCRFLVDERESRHWEPRTGGWNTAFEATALSIEALTETSYCNSVDTIVQESCEYLIENRNQWMKPELDIDGATAACVVAKNVDGEQSIIDYINHVSKTNQHIIVSNTHSLDYDENQTCTTSQIAFFLIKLGWDILRMEMPSILNTFLGRATVAKKTVFISYSHDSKRHSKRVRRIAEFLQQSGFDILFDQFLPPGTNIPAFMDRITDCDIILVIGTEGYAKKAKSLQGGVIYEKCVISVHVMEGNLEKIVPIAIGGEFRKSLPKVFASNKGFDTRRIDSSFLNTLAKELQLI